MLNVIAIIVLGIVALLMLLLVVPVEIDFNVQHGDSRRNDIALCWLFGIIQLPLKARFGKKSRKEKAKKSKKKSGRSGGRSLLRLARDGNVRRRFIVYVRRLLRAIKIKTLDVGIRLGLDDPADTGQLWGVLGPLNSSLAGIPKARVWIEPEFAAEVFSLQSHGRIRIIPAHVLAVSLFFFLSPSVLRAMVYKP